MSSPGRTILAVGRTAEVLAWQDQQILKLFYDWMPADDIEREINAARLVSATILPTPKLLGEVTLGGRRGLVYERVSGSSLVNLLTTRPWNIVRYARRFAELHAAIHRQRGQGLPPLKAALEQTIRRIDGLPPDLLAASLDRLAQLPDGDTLLHADFHPDQVMMTASGLVVLDWLTALSGHPAADVTRTVLLLRIGSLPYGSRLMILLINLLRGIFLRTYLHRYCQLNPAVTPAAIDAWLPLVALARLEEGIPGEKEKLIASIAISRE
jgi:aminoglycoside phosphotransferase (APT) family kinase protein